MDDLTVDPNRLDIEESTGIYVRAKNGDEWDSFDILQLDKPSLKAWLRSRGGENEWAESVVLLLLGHNPNEED